MSLSDDILELRVAAVGAHDLRILSLLIGIEVGCANCVGSNESIEDMRSCPSLLRESSDSATVVEELGGVMFPRKGDVWSSFLPVSIVRKGVLMARLKPRDTF
jgi:hypothetical protein